jgi:hypothetical protein
MKPEQMSDQEKKTYKWLVNEAQPSISKYQRKIAIISVVMFLIIVAAIWSWWVSPTVTISESLLLGGQLYSLYGGLLLAVGAFSSPSTLALLSMTRWNGNSSLFASLMNTRVAARVGVCFVVGGFAVQGATMLVFGN